MSDAQPTPIADYIKGLDGLRAVSVFLVILTHVGFLPILGSVGVTVFFFISGYLITNLLITERAREGRVDVKAFYVRRYLRIFPEQAAYVALGFLGSALIGRTPDIINALGGLLYFGNYLKIFHVGFGGNPFTLGHLWSLAVEEHFYLTWPLAFVALSARPSRMVGFLCAVLVGCSAWRLVAVGLISADYTYYASDTRFDSIAYGCLCAVLMRHYPRFAASVATVRPFLPLAAGALMLAPIALRVVSPDNATLQTLDYTLQGFGLFALFAYMQGNDRSLLTRALALAPLRFAGRVSYGAYLWHFSVIYIAAAIMGQAKPENLSLVEKVIVVAVTVPLANLLGWLSLTCVQGPFKAVRRRFGSHVPGSPTRDGDPSPGVRAGADV